MIQSMVCNMLASFAIEWWLTKERRLVTEKIVILHQKKERERERERDGKVGW